MKTLLSCLLVASGTLQSPQQGTPTPPPEPVQATAPFTRDAFLTSKAEEGRRACKAAIVATAKDPDSVKFLDDGSYELGRGLFRNDIIFTFPIMGRNTYGAVLQHTMTCTVTCKEKTGCKAPRVNEY